MYQLIAGIYVILCLWTALRGRISRQKSSKELYIYIYISIYVTPVFIFGCSKLPVVVTMVYVFKHDCYFESVFQYPLKFIEYYTL